MPVLNQDICVSKILFTNIFYCTAIVLFSFFTAQSFRLAAFFTHVCASQCNKIRDAHSTYINSRPF